MFIADTRSSRVRYNQLLCPQPARLEKGKKRMKKALLYFCLSIISINLFAEMKISTKEIKKRNSLFNRYISKYPKIPFPFSRKNGQS